MYLLHVTEEPGLVQMMEAVPRPCWGSLCGAHQVIRTGLACEPSHKVSHDLSATVDSAAICCDVPCVSE